jgi:hypothetical protein
VQCKIVAFHPSRIASFVHLPFPFFPFMASFSTMSSEWTGRNHFCAMNVGMTALALTTPTISGMASAFMQTSTQTHFVGVISLQKSGSGELHRLLFGTNYIFLKAGCQEKRQAAT